MFFLLNIDECIFIVITILNDERQDSPLETFHSNDWLRAPSRQKHIQPMGEDSLPMHLNENGELQKSALHRNLFPFECVGGIWPFRPGRFSFELGPIFFNSLTIEE